MTCIKDIDRMAKNTNPGLYVQIFCVNTVYHCHCQIVSKIDYYNDRFFMYTSLTRSKVKNSFQNLKHSCLSTIFIFLCFYFNFNEPKESNDLLHVSVR